jgi:hypothetical protein
LPTHSVSFPPANLDEMRAVNQTIARSRAHATVALGSGRPSTKERSPLSDSLVEELGLPVPTQAKIDVDGS